MAATLAVLSPTRASVSLSSARSWASYKKITQTKALDITFVPEGSKLKCYSSNKSYGMRDWLDNNGKIILPVSVMRITIDTLNLST